MVKTELSEKDLRKIIREIINEDLLTYYVANSSYFDTNAYDINQIAKAVKKAGGTNIRNENAYGWSNQPEVLVFDAAEGMVEDIAAEVSRMLGTDWVIIREKDW